MLWSPADPLLSDTPGSSFTHIRTGGTSFSTSLSGPAGPVQHAAPAAPAGPGEAAAAVARPRHHQHHTLTAATTLSPLTTPPPLLEIRVPLPRGRGSAARRLPQGGAGLGQEDVPRLRSPSPQVDYEYYDDDADAAPSATKVKIHGDGWIECLDRGNFPHPFSCRKFISCAKMESGDLQGWEYTCPRGLSFDPIGGICNWSAGLGCKA
ncbi:hypothetical protein ONE63_000803 [Megalurothrips usitatus]|uniref:Chitin-binding type-2 domain-containing protein n=1 Tax=Megalurothrips usitatus TaxID=439358 RepID=A0AAV7XZK9_9NEOP|nr:hypothetical protein ONE63_000803 [Megalurothrips usitatus]